MRLYTMNPGVTAPWGFDAFETFDRLFAPLGRTDNSPAYDVAKRDEDHFRVDIVVPGYAEDALEITQEGDDLLVTGKAREDAEGTTYLRRAIGTQGFESRFQLGENVRVAGAKLANGVLSVELVREVPEALKPRRIAINGAPAIANKAAA
ncbi:MAG: Hsp20 family protein [Alphaproteobacteria bacterium]|nr:Hsp20 family protein [Alphaproteobacteria bacterium]